MASTRQRKTDEMTAFDVGQLLLFAEKVDENRGYGREDARCRAASQIPLVFDSPMLQDAGRRADPLLPSFLAVSLNMVAQRRDWASQRLGFIGAVRDAHLAEAECRMTLLEADPCDGPLAGLLAAHQGTASACAARLPQ